MTYENPYIIPVIRESYCAYVDILGIKKLIVKEFGRGSGRELYNRFVGVLDKATEWSENVNLPGMEHLGRWELRTFSDNYVWGYPIDERLYSVQFIAFLLFLSYFQAFMIADEEFFIRGGIFSGSLIMDSNIVLGSALVEAYKLESEEAVNPRILISQEIISRIKQDVDIYNNQPGELFRRLILVDPDGHAFINYLSTTVFGPNSIEWDPLKKHKSVIENRLDQFKNEPKICSKYAWVASYHNYCLESALKNSKYSDNTIELRELIIDIQTKTLEFGEYK